MSIMQPQIEMVDRSTQSIRYLQHGWPSDLCRWHAHDEYELHLIVDTRGKAFVGDFIGDFKPGDLYLTGPNLPHNWITDEIWSESVDIRDMLVQFSEDSIARLVEAFPEFSKVQDMLTLGRSGILFEGFNSTFARGHFEAIRDSKGPERILAFVRFLVRLNEHAEKRILSVANLVKAKGDSKHARIGLVVDQIVENFADDISLSEAAEIAGMTDHTFSRNFQVVTGRKFVEFVTQIRIGQACGMLYATDSQVTEICYKVGFKNLANFNRQFLKLKGITPSTYRDTARRDLLRDKAEAS